MDAYTESAKENILRANRHGDPIFAQIAMAESLVSIAESLASIENLLQNSSALA